MHVKIIFSPSKSQNINAAFFTETTATLFPKMANILTERILACSEQEIQKTFKLSRNKSIELLENIKIKKPKRIAAIDLFSGTSFRELDTHTYTNEQRVYLNNNLCILSALYGILLPLNPVALYRFDMNNNILKNTDFKNLYNFWSPSILGYLKGEPLIINLASGEYSRMIQGINQKNIITLHFLMIENGKEKTPSVFSKQQRGRMLDHLIKNLIVDPKDIKKYSSDGFSFNKERSDKNNYFFVKE